MMEDYIGKYVKPFVTGTRTSITLRQGTNDWGLSCGTFQLTLRHGYCINFLHEYFPNESVSLYFNDKEDFVSSKWEGYDYCSSPDAVKAIWMKCYNKVGADKFFSYEYSYMHDHYYMEIADKLSSILDLKTACRAFQECFWSWSIDKGVEICYETFKGLLDENNITSLEYVNQEELFDLIYDRRYEVDRYPRFKRGIASSSSERETIRPLLQEGTFSGKEKDIDPIDDKDKKPVPEYTVVPKEGTVKIVSQDNKGVDILEYPFLDSDVVYIEYYGTHYNVKGESNNFYQLENGYFVTKDKGAVHFEEKNNRAIICRVRIVEDKTPFYKYSNDTSEIVGYLKKNKVYNIIESHNGYLLISSNSGWLKEDSNIKRYN